jgi:hypothetical protein
MIVTMTTIVMIITYDLLYVYTYGDESGDVDAAPGTRVQSSPVRQWATLPNMCVYFQNKAQFFFLSYLQWCHITSLHIIPSVANWNW